MVQVKWSNKIVILKLDERGWFRKGVKPMLQAQFIRECLPIMDSHSYQLVLYNRLKISVPCIASGYFQLGLLNSCKLINYFGLAGRERRDNRHFYINLFCFVHQFHNLCDHIQNIIVHSQARIFKLFISLFTIATKWQGYSRRRIVSNKNAWRVTNLTTDMYSRHFKGH